GSQPWPQLPGPGIALSWSRRILLSSTDASEHENCRPLLRSEGHVALVYEADHASGIERVGIDNLLILLATRAAGRFITRPCDNPDRRSAYCVCKPYRGY